MGNLYGAYFRTEGYCCPMESGRIGSRLPEGAKDCSMSDTSRIHEHTVKIASSTVSPNTSRENDSADFARSNLFVFATLRETRKYDTPQDLEVASSCENVLQPVLRSPPFLAQTRELVHCLEHVDQLRDASAEKVESPEDQRLAEVELLA